jgi:hypothetical protein
LFQELNDKRQRLDDAKEVVKELQKNYDYLSMIIVPARMEEEGIDGIKIEGIGRINIRSDMRVSTLQEYRHALFEWLGEHGHGDLISETVNGSTLKAWVKEQIGLGNEIPEEFLKIHAYDRAVITKG